MKKKNLIKLKEKKEKYKTNNGKEIMLIKENGEKIYPEITKKIEMVEKIEMAIENLEKTIEIEVKIEIKDIIETPGTAIKMPNLAMMLLNKHLISMKEEIEKKEEVIMKEFQYKTLIDKTSQTKRRDHQLQLKEHLKTE
jgi:hypothetical protein